MASYTERERERGGEGEGEGEGEREVACGMQSFKADSHYRRHECAHTVTYALTT